MCFFLPPAFEVPVVAAVDFALPCSFGVAASPVKDRVFAATDAARSLAALSIASAATTASAAASASASRSSVLASDREDRLVTGLVHVPSEVVSTGSRR